MKIQHIKVCGGEAKTGLKGKCVALNACFKRGKISKINDLSLHLTKKRKVWPGKPEQV